jgi:hypothetical protein
MDISGSYQTSDLSLRKKLLCGNYPVIDFAGGTAIRFCDQNRIAIDPDWFLIAIMIAIAVSKSGPDCAMMFFEIITVRYNVSLASCPIPQGKRQFWIRQDCQPGTDRDGGDHFIPCFLQSKKQFIVGFPERNSDKPISSKNENLR